MTGRELTAVVHAGYLGPRSAFWSEDMEVCRLKIIPRDLMEDVYKNAQVEAGIVVPKIHPVVAFMRGGFQAIFSSVK